MTDSKISRLHIIVVGRVQGVCFRHYTKESATSLGLTGWVRNLPDGNVEIVAEGPAEKLRALEDWAKQGPPAAEVTRIHARILPAMSDLEGFTVRR